MAVERPRINRECKTVAVMIALYCRKHHGGNELCSECKKLLEYAEGRLANCPFQDAKTTCTKCPVHCYKPTMREKIRTVMRYSGPRMIYRHPALAIFHLLDGRRKEPGTKQRVQCPSPVNAGVAPGSAIHVQNQRHSPGMYQHKGSE
jgi:hypothetical protein